MPQRWKIILLTPATPGWWAHYSETPTSKVTNRAAVAFWALVEDTGEHGRGTVVRANVQPDRFIIGVTPEFQDHQLIDAAFVLDGRGYEYDPSASA